MARSRSVIAPKRPGKTALENLPAEADAWVRSPAHPRAAVATPTDADASGAAALPHTDTRTAEPDQQADAGSSNGQGTVGEQGGGSQTERADPGHSTSSTPPQGRNKVTGRQVRPPRPKSESPHEEALPADERPVKFTLDVPVNLHRAMKIQTIKRRTTIVATVRTILGNYYGRTADVSPGEYKIAASEPTKRLTLDLDPDLHTEMMLQKVLRGANVQAEVLRLVADHYLPEEAHGAAATG
jgi:hypothetical protein